MFEEGAALKERYGAGCVFDLSLGNPIVEPPPEFHEALAGLAASPVPGMHRYMPNAGYPETRAAVAAELKLETGFGFSADDIVMTCGAAGALNVVLKTLLNEGDEVIVFAPYFPEYLNYVENHGGVAKVITTGPDFLPRLDTLETAIGEKTRAVLINSPNNPTGVVYPESLVRGLGELLRRKSTRFGRPVFLVSDEPYRRIIYDGLKYPAIWPHYAESLVVTSHSKDLALPGERIGYAAVHPACCDKGEIVAGLIYANRVLGYVNAPALMQRLVARLQGVTVSIADYQDKRDRFYEGLTAVGYSVVKPQGAFYLFPRSPVEDDVAFVRGLQEELVLTVPGRGFGTPGYFRIAYCVDDRTVEGSLAGFRRVAARHGLC